MPVKKKSKWVGFDLGGTKMLAAVMDDKFKKKASVKKRTRNSDDGPSDILERIIATIEEVIDGAGLKASDISGLGIGVPGPVDHKKGIVMDTPNLGWKNVPLKRTLEKKFGFPVRVANDVDAGTYGEYIGGAGKKADCLIGAFPGTGLGGGCVVNGKIFQGARFTCMEIGHFPMMPQAPVWGKRQFATLETLTSRLCVSKEAAVEVFRGRAPALDKIAGSDFRRYKSGALAEAAKKDEVIEEIVHDAAAWLGVGLAGFVNVFAPDVIVLGGGMVEAMPKQFRDVVEKTMKRQVMEVYRDSFEVRVAELGDDAAVIGAAGLIMEQEQDDV